MRESKRLRNREQEEEESSGSGWLDYTFKASWGLSSFTPGLNNMAGSCLPISSFLAPSALILLLLQISLSECSATQRKCRPYIATTTSFKIAMLHTLHLFVMIRLKSFPFILSLSCCFTLIHLMYIPSSWSLFSFFPCFPLFPHVWCG